MGLSGPHKNLEFDAISKEKVLSGDVLCSSHSGPFIAVGDSGDEMRPAPHFFLSKTKECWP